MLVFFGIDWADDYSSEKNSGSIRFSSYRATTLTPKFQSIIRVSELLTVNKYDAFANGFDVITRFFRIIRCTYQNSLVDAAPLHASHESLDDRTANGTVPSLCWEANRFETQYRHRGHDMGQGNQEGAAGLAPDFSAEPGVAARL